MSEPNAQEPTMEEILASIRRIISEDDQGAAEVEADAEAEPAFEPDSTMAAPAPAMEATAPPSAPMMEPAFAEPEDDVLELTERAPEVETIGDLDLYPPADARPHEEPAPAPAPAPEPIAYVPVQEAKPLVSGHAAESAAGAFGRLAQRVAMPKEGRSLEDVVRDMLNPLLKAWLDENLPAIVQAKVDEEVERIARRSL